ncbi:hypothetical protein EW146_g8591 [Bondarzewia mesenterica]|uniref:FAD-binding PCMH-type domain-containing protein n=1 Tax=Bondarzewia mesenterica TaxID=1095465 RepID=A0A4S4LEX0_9AGAM|nr:hypothetical protein EW146_g8591 [Bondarzewia mesenterica]
MHKQHILSFPTELSIHVFEYLDVRTLVCRQWYTLIQGALCLQYKIELAMSGLENRLLLPSTAPLPDQLKSLQQHQRAWRRLEWTCCRSLPMSRPSGHFLCEVALHNGILAYMGEPSDTVFIRRLPSPLLAIDEDDWIIHIPKMRFEAFVINPRQDLLVLLDRKPNEDDLRTVAFHIHLLSMQNGCPHPTASSPIISFITPLRTPQLSYNIQITEQFLGVFFPDHTRAQRSRLVLWSWKTGNIHMELVRDNIESFTFFTDKHVLVLMWKSSLAANLDRDLEPALLVFDITKSSSHHVFCDDAAYTLAFLFPSPSSHLHLWGIGMWADHSSLSSSVHPQDQPCADSIVLIRLYAIGTGRSSAVARRRFRLLEIFVPASVLAQHVHKVCIGGKRRQILPWDQWISGARVQHSFPGDTLSPRNAMSGMRYMDVKPPADGSGDRLVVQLMDFSVLRIARAMGTATKEIGVRYPEDVPRGFWNDQVVVSRAPCLLKEVEVRAEESIRSIGLRMISENALVIANGTDEEDVLIDDLIAHCGSGKTDKPKLELDGIILTPSSEGYESSLHRISDLTVRRAAYVAFPTSFDDVPKLIDFARTNSTDIAIKGGGHTTNDSGASSSDGGLVIDMSKLNKVTVLEEKGTIVAQAGATWGDVYAEAAKYNVDVVGGDVCTVGIGGFLTGGGHSNRSGQHGLGIDNIVEATVTLADGRIVKASPTQEPDLFWAIQGGQSQFGVILQFILRAYPTQGPAFSGPLVFPGTAFESFVPVLEEFITTKMGVQDHLIVEFSRAPPHFYPGLVVIPYIPGPPSRADDLLKSFRSLNPIVDFVHPVPTQYDASHGGDEILARAPKRQYLGGAQFNDTAAGLDKEVFEQMWGEFVKFTEEHPEAKENIFMWQWQPVGVVKDRKSDETAFSKRSSLSYVLVHGRHRVPEFDQANIAWVRKTVGIIRDKYPNGGAIPNFACGDESAVVIYGAENAKKLKEIKAKYDPAGFWKKAESPIRSQKLCQAMPIVVAYSCYDGFSIHKTSYSILIESLTGLRGTEKTSHYSSADFAVPFFDVRLSPNMMHNWNYMTTKQTGLKDRTTNHPRGKLTGVSENRMSSMI